MNNQFISAMTEAVYKAADLGIIRSDFTNRTAAAYGCKIITGCNYD